MTIGSKKSVVYSFNGRWLEALKSGAVKVFFRKKCPTATPSRVYLYVGAPIKEIIGYAEVQHIQDVSLDEALSLTEQGAISPQEVANYVGNGSSVHAIWIHSLILFSEPLSLLELREATSFNPPQSFCNISKELQEMLDRAEK